MAGDPQGGLAAGRGRAVAGSAPSSPARRSVAECGQRATLGPVRRAARGTRAASPAPDAGLPTAQAYACRPWPAFPSSAAQKGQMGSLGPPEPIPAGPGAGRGGTDQSLQGPAARANPCGARAGRGSGRSQSERDLWGRRRPSGTPGKWPWAGAGAAGVAGFWTRKDSRDSAAVTVYLKGTSPVLGLLSRAQRFSACVGFKYLIRDRDAPWEPHLVSLDGSPGLRWKGIEQNWLRASTYPVQWGQRWV